MLQQIIFYTDLIAYSFITSQAMFYFLGMSQAVKGLEAESFIEFKNLLDSKLQISLRLVYYGGLLLSLVWCYIAVSTCSLLLTITSTIALFALVADVFFLLKGNQPINKTIQTWDADNYPENWRDFKKQWFNYYHKRQIVDLLGFFSLLAGAVFR